MLRCTVSSPIPAGMPRLTQFQKFMPWVIIAPFGRPVVPEVYMIVTTSSWVSVTRSTGVPVWVAIACSYALSAEPPSIWRRAPMPHRRCSSAAASANSTSCTISIGELSPTMYSSSLTVSRQLSSTQIAPVRAHANCTSKNSTPLWASTATRSPRPMPSEPKWAAIASMRRSRSA